MVTRITEKNPLTKFNAGEKDTYNNLKPVFKPDWHTDTHKPIHIYR